MAHGRSQELLSVPLPLLTFSQMLISWILAFSSFGNSFPWYGNKRIRQIYLVVRAFIRMAHTF